MTDRRSQSIFSFPWRLTLCAAAALVGCADSTPTEVAQPPATPQDEIATAAPVEQVGPHSTPLRYPISHTRGVPQLQPVALEFPAPPLPGPPSIPAAADAPYQPRAIGTNSLHAEGGAPKGDEAIVADDSGEDASGLGNTDEFADNLMRLPAIPEVNDDENAAQAKVDANEAVVHSPEFTPSIVVEGSIDPHDHASEESLPIADVADAKLEQQSGDDRAGIIESRWGPVDLAAEGDVHLPTDAAQSRWNVDEPAQDASVDDAHQWWEEDNPHEAPQTDIVEVLEPSVENPAEALHQFPTNLENAAPNASDDDPSSGADLVQRFPFAQSRIARLPAVVEPPMAPVTVEVEAEDAPSISDPVVVKPLAPELMLPEALEDDHRDEPTTTADLDEPSAEAPSPVDAESPQTATLEPPVVEIDQQALAANTREQAMHAVRMRAEALVRHAFSLGQRGAKYSARAELIEALRMSSQALDAQAKTRKHSEALALAFRALEEADDFVPRGTALDANIDMSVLARGHKTPVLKEADLSELTPLVALQQYYTFAQEQLIIAAGGERPASAALFGLGQLESLMHKKAVGGITRGAPKAMVFHQAAMMTDPANYKAANELGVLLARYGQYEQARDVLVHSVRVSPQPESWNNLATVHQHLGQHDLARRAAYESQLAARNQPSSGEYADAFVRWVAPEELAGDIDAMDQMQIPAPEQPDAPPIEAVPASQTGGSRLMRLIPWVRGE